MAVRFDGQTAVVVGGGKGLGKLCARTLASYGANVVVNDHVNQRVVNNVVKEIQAAGGKAISNHSTPDRGVDIIQAAITHFGKVDMLLFDGTTENAPPWTETSQENWNDLLSVNFKLSYKVVNAVWPYFKKQAYGRILSINTLGGKDGSRGCPLSSAAKFGLLGFHQTVAREGAKYNIVANILATDADITSILHEQAFGIDSEPVPRTVASLLHANNKSETGHLYVLEGSRCQKLRWQRSLGASSNPDKGLSPGSVLDQWTDVNDFTNATYPHKSADFESILEKTQRLGLAVPRKDIRFDGKVALITGAGGGLGRAYALLFGSLGARVIVNDLKDPSAVVSEIKNAGGEAHGVIYSVSEGEKIVAETVRVYGRIDILVNNAGFVRDKSIANMTDELWDSIMEVHLNGLYKVTKTAWPHFVRQDYGRIVNISSTSGVYGNFGQSNYSFAKCAVIGITEALAREGAQHNILVNAVAPLASTQGLADAVVGSSSAILPQYSAPMVVLLCSDVVPYPATGGLFEIGAGWHARTRLEASQGVNWRSDRDFDADTMSNALSVLAQFDQEFVSYPAEDALALLNKQAYRKGTVSRIEAAKQARTEGSIFEYTQKDVILYNLSLGAKSTDLPLIYENHPNFQVLPTYGTIPWFGATLPYAHSDILPDWNPSKYLHGEIYLEIRKHPIPTSARLITFPRLLHVLDKQKAAVVTTAFTTQDAMTREDVFYSESSIYVRDAGVFGGPKDVPSTNGVSTASRLRLIGAPEREPDFIYTENTTAEQAAVYRLNGDTNALHIDPIVARQSGFSGPILHGLCFFGIAGKHIYQKYGAYRIIRGRFVGSVVPGQTVKTEAWVVDGQGQGEKVVLFQMRVVETGRLCVSGGRAEGFGVGMGTEMGRSRL